MWRTAGDFSSQPQRHLHRAVHSMLFPRVSDEQISKCTTVFYNPIVEVTNHYFCCCMLLAHRPTLAQGGTESAHKLTYRASGRRLQVLATEASHAMVSSEWMIQGVQREWPPNLASDLPSLLLCALGHKDQFWYHVGRDCPKLWIQEAGMIGDYLRWWFPQLTSLWVAWQTHGMEFSLRASHEKWSSYH